MMLAEKYHKMPFDPEVSGIEPSLGKVLTLTQSALLQASGIVEMRERHYRERREKLKNAKFHKPGGSTVISSFDVINYGDEDFDVAAPYGQGIFDDFLLKKEPRDTGNYVEV